MPGLGGAGAAAGAGSAGLGVAGAALGEAIPNAALPGQPSTGMPGMAISPQQLKQMQEQYGKMGMDSTQLRAMQQMMSGMPGGVAPAAAAAPPSPAAGSQAVSREKGRLVLRQLPWAPGGDARLQGGELKFAMAVHEVAVAMEPGVKRYKIEARVEDQGDKTQNKMLARKRADAIVAALVTEWIPANRLSTTDGKSDKDPRIIVSETK
jgi:hypothetical protein